MAMANVVTAWSGTKDVEDDPRCHLFGPTALIVQAIMGVLVLASLVYKRHRESPRRKWKIWFAKTLSSEYPTFMLTCTTCAGSLMFQSK